MTDRERQIAAPDGRFRRQLDDLRKQLHDHSIRYGRTAGGGRGPVTHCLLLGPRDSPVRLASVPTARVSFAGRSASAVPPIRPAAVATESIAGRGRLSRCGLSLCGASSSPTPAWVPSFHGYGEPRRRHVARPSRRPDFAWVERLIGAYPGHDDPRGAHRLSRAPRRPSARATMRPGWPGTRPRARPRSRCSHRQALADYRRSASRRRSLQQAGRPASAPRGGCRSDPGLPKCPWPLSLASWHRVARTAAVRADREACEDGTGARTGSPPGRPRRQEDASVDTARR
jgi:hypothetical protein